MSDCRCSGTPGQSDTWDYHSDYCPVYMRGRIAELEKWKEADNKQICGQRAKIDELEQELAALREAFTEIKKVVDPRTTAMESGISRVHAVREIIRRHSALLQESSND